MTNYVRQVTQQDQLNGAARIHTTKVVERGPDRGVARVQLALYYVVSVLSAVLLIRFVLSLFGANRANGFADAIYGITGPLVAPFQGLFGYNTTYGVSRVEIETIVAILVYMLVGWLFSSLLNLARRDIEEIDLDI